MLPSPRKITLLSEELSREAGKVRTAAQESGLTGPYCTRFAGRKQGFLRKEVGFGALNVREVTFLASNDKSPGPCGPGLQMVRFAESSG